MILLNIAAVFVFFGAGVFVATYSLLAPWWRTQEGVNVMTFTLATAGLAALRCLAMILGNGFAGQDVLRVVLMTAIAAAAWHRWVMVMRAQLRNLHPPQPPV
jgi:hypothetical protein